MASLAFDPSNSNTIYAGTGEGVGNADAIRGAGVFKSTDAGATWTQLAGTATTDFFYVNSLVVSPRNTQRLSRAPAPASSGRPTAARRGPIWSRTRMMHASRTSAIGRNWFRIRVVREL
ncbi:MAG: hypothetical protein U0P30_03960 [Vicinamibacterales bacterium]